MNLLFTSPTYYPHKGGAESCIEDLATAYLRKGHKVTVVTSRSPCSLPAHENRNGVAIIRLKYPPHNVENLRQAFLVFTRCFSALFGIVRLIKKQRIDVVCLGLIGLDSFLVLLLKYFLRFKLIVYIHGGELRSYVKISPLICWTLKRSLRRCDAVIAVSEQLQDETIAFAPSVRNRIFVIPNGVDITSIVKQKSYEYAGKYLLYVGRLHPVKGIDTLIKAFHQISAQIPNLDLFIVGTGPLENSLKKMVAERGLTGRIMFLGAQERSDVFALLKGCEFQVLTSHAEGCPVVLLEAMAAGKVTIGSRTKGITNIIQDEKTGALFNHGDVDDLSKLIRQYHMDQAKRSQLEANIRSNGLQQYDIRSLCEKHLEVYSGFRRQLRLCLISHFYYQDENCSGLSSYYFNLAESLSNHGHALYLITSENSCPGNEVPGLRTIKIGARDLVSQNYIPEWIKSLRRIAARLLFSFRAYLKVRKLDRSIGVDVVIAPELFAPGLFLGFLMGKKLITRIHTPTYISDHYNERYQYQFIGKILSLPEKAQAKLSRGLSVASQHLASAIAKDWAIPKNKIQIIPNSVQIDWVRHLAGEQAREISGDYLLYFGRLEKRKGVHIISQALPEVFSRWPTIKMVFIGKDCGLKAEILRQNARYQRNIVFLGTVEKARLFGAVRHAKLILLPSLFENLSNAGLEAMALGRPVIGTYRTAFAEIIEDDRNGFLVEPEDPQALGAKILSCLESKDLERIGQNAYESVQRFDSTRIVLETLEFYRKTMSSS